MKQDLELIKELKVAEEEVTIFIEGLQEQINKIGDIHVTSSLCLDQDKSTSQFIYGVGITNQQIISSEELGLDKEVERYLNQKKNIIKLFKLRNTLKRFSNYRYEINVFKGKYMELISDETKKALLIETLPECPED